MKTMFVILLILSLTSCSTSQIELASNIKSDAIENMAKEDKVIGSDFPDWINMSGVENGVVYTVGNAEFSADKSPGYIKKAAMMDAEVKLLSDAPSDFRILTQSALNGAGIDSNEFYQIQTKMQKVIGLTGIKFNSKKVACRKIIRYGELDTRLTRSCYVQVYIAVKDLTKAYQRTLAYQFGQPIANKYAELMNKEVDAIRKDEKVNKKEK